MINITQEQILNNWKVDSTFSPIVSICCITYNHAPYIRQCLDSFLSQKTNFPFEIVIHDDCSTDGTKEIIDEYVKKYPSIFVPLFEKENQYTKGVRGMFSHFVMPIARGKYVALCDGDDYWIDENKLQLQVNFLEKNRNYGLCYTYAKKFYQEKHQFSKKKHGKRLKTPKDLIIRGDRIPTLTICIRRDLLKEYLKFINTYGNNWSMGDYPLVLWYSINSKIYCLNRITAVYRVLEKSASHFRTTEEALQFTKTSNDIQKLFCKLFNLKISEEKLDSIYTYMCIWRLLSLNDYYNAKLLSKNMGIFNIKSFLLKIYLRFK